MTGEDDTSGGELGEETTLLIVDDDKPFLTRLARAMEGRGFQVETAESVEEAVAKARENPPAYAVVDMRLGDGNGLDVVKAIREKRETPARLFLPATETSLRRSRRSNSARSTTSQNPPMQTTSTPL